MYYVYDGTFEGFLSAVTELFRGESEEHGRCGKEASVCKEAEIRPLIPHIEAEVIEGITCRFGEYLSGHFGKAMPDTVYRAFLSELPGIEDSLIRYIRLARRIRKDPIDMLNVECVRQVAQAYKRTSRETHRYMGLLRFRKLNITDPSSRVEIFYAEFEPQTDCLSLLADHFTDRFEGIPFVIADRSRNKCLLHMSGNDWTIREADPELFSSKSVETLYEALWQRYFKCMAIPERINPKLQSSNMPRKYWKHLVEKPGEIFKSSIQ